MDINNPQTEYYRVSYWIDTPSYDHCNGNLGFNANPTERLSMPTANEYSNPAAGQLKKDMPKTANRSCIYTHRCFWESCIRI